MANETTDTFNSQELGAISKVAKFVETFNAEEYELQMAGRKRQNLWAEVRFFRDGEVVAELVDANAIRGEAYTAELVFQVKVEQ